jgi:hypothetical protein
MKKVLDKECELSLHPKKTGKGRTARMASAAEIETGTEIHRNQNGSWWWWAHINGPAGGSLYRQKA